LMVNLYAASTLLKPSMSSPMYFNLAQSRKLVRVALDREAHFIISCPNSLQALPHLNRGRLSAERSVSVVPRILSTSGPRTPLKASSSTIRSRTRVGCERKLLTMSYRLMLDWKANVARVSSPEARLMGSAMLSKHRGEKKAFEMTKWLTLAQGVSGLSCPFMAERDSSYMTVGANHKWTPSIHDCDRSVSNQLAHRSAL
jgi:hypothetical protein